MSTILITGCSCGVGYLTALELAGRGQVVFATVRDIEGKNAAAADRLRSEVQAGEGTCTCSRWT
jgi:NAD(P)-dependent dehydrogenase (short-subunit alcohol dehydrogenase family)